MKKIALMWSLLILLPSTIFAATYYVDATNGSDSNAGTSEAVPWGTIAKVNNTQLQPGDLVFFKRGETWREQLTVTSSGTSDNPITFGAYGSGHKPRIIGSEEFLGISDNWTHLGDNTWKRSMEIECKTVVFNNTYVGVNEDGSINNGKDKNGLIDTPHDWHWDTHSLYVYSAGNPTSYYSSIHAGQRYHAILVPADTRYIRIENLDARTANRPVITIAGSYTIVANCDVSHNWFAGIYIDKTGYHNNVHSCNVSYTCRQENQAITVEGHHTQVFNNYIHDNFNEGIDVYLGATHCQIYGNTVEGTGEYAVGIYVDGARYVDIFQNTVRKCSLGIAVADELGIGVSDVNIYYNILRANYNGIRIQDGGSNYKIVNNVIYGNISWGLRILGNCLNTYIHNNIFYDSYDNANDGAFYIQNGTGIHSDYNCFFVYSPWDNLIQFEEKVYTISQFPSYQLDFNQDAHSQALDPLFINPSNNDFQLVPTSTLIDAGIDVGLTEDYNRMVVPQGSGVDMGAFEQGTEADITGTITINDGAAVTRSLNVLLTIFATHDGQSLDENAQMTFRNDNQEWSDPEPYARTKVWMLSPGEGVKAVYVKFSDPTGNWTPVTLQDEIMYEASENSCDDPQMLSPLSITASSVSPFSAIEYALDGNPVTAWSTFSFFQKEEYITLDLGELKSVSSFNMFAAKLYGLDYFPANFQIQTSRDNINWLTVRSEQGYSSSFEPPYSDSWSFDNILCRYIRVYITRAKTLLLFLHITQIAEIEVYGCNQENLSQPQAERDFSINDGEDQKRSKELQYKPTNLSSVIPGTPGRPTITFPE